jgi:hypothetical protein
MRTATQLSTRQEARLRIMAATGEMSHADMARRLKTTKAIIETAMKNLGIEYKFKCYSYRAGEHDRMPRMKVTGDMTHIDGREVDYA